MKIVVLDGYTLNPSGDNPWDAIEKLGTLIVHPRTHPEDVVRIAHDAEIILTNKVPLSAQTLTALKNLRMISVLATGYNMVDIEKARSLGIPVCNIPEYSTEAVAQFTFALILELCHHVGTHSDLVFSGEWERCADFSFRRFPLKELFGKTLGVVGFGRIGKRVAAIGHAFGMQILCTSRSHPKELPEWATYTSLEEIFSHSDIVSLHCPLTEENKGFVQNRLLDKMKKDAFLINVSRGGLINEADLARALNAEKIAGAGVDVLSTEPPSSDNPLLKAKNGIITPHIAWAPIEARRRVIQGTAENIKAFLKGKPIHVVNGLP